MKSYSKYFNAFTLAEMMVVLLIMSIVLACLAPAMTTKMKADQSIQTSPWKWARNNTDAYFSVNSSQSAMIGQSEKADADNAKLIINNADTTADMILFKNSGTENSKLFVNSNSIQLGKLASGTTRGASSVSYGTNLRPTGANSLTIGNNTTSSGSNSMSIGNSISSSYTVKSTGTRSIAIGNFGYINAGTFEGENMHYNGAEASGDYTLAVGTNTYAKGNYSTALGLSAQAIGQKSTSIGNYTMAKGDSSVVVGETSGAFGTQGSAFGNNARVWGDHAVAISESKAYGNYSLAMIGGQTGSADSSNTGNYGIAIGKDAQVNGSYGIAIGSGAKVPSTVTNSSSEASVAIGYKAMGDTVDGKSTYSNVAIGHQALLNTTSGYNVAIGHKALIGNTTGQHNIAIGSFSMDGWNGSSYSTSGNYNTTLGYASCRYVTGSNKTCIGANSGPATNHAWAKDNVERIFIGSQSKFNNGPAALEVHNGINVGGNQYTISSSKGLAQTVVVVNGALLVKGGIITSMPWVDDNRFASDGGVNLIGRTGGQLEPVDVDWNGNSNQVSGEFGGSDRGQFLSPNSHNGYGFSDRRLKYVGKESTDGLEKIKQLKVFNYTFKKDKEKTPRVGVIAQDLQKIFPNAVKKASDGFLTIRMEDMFFAVINAIKELDARVTALEKENKLLKEQNKALDARLKALEAKVK